MAVDPAQRDLIQSAYSNYLKGRHIKARPGQRQMIGAIANYLSDIQVDGEGRRTSDPCVCVIEAGTGTGKTLAYLVGTLPFARHLQKKVIIATATVTLQQQILAQELPLFREHSGLDFTAALAKGRARYVCLHKLDLFLQEPDSRGADLFFATAASSDSTTDASSEFTHEVSPSHRNPALRESFAPSYPTQAYQQLLDRMTVEGWNGDIDTLQEPVDEGLWRTVTVDHRQCLNRTCGYFQQCPYFRCKADQEQAEVIVANHDLVLADLALGGGIVLPPPGESLYVFDEAHHLPEKTIQHFSAHAGLVSSRATLNTLSRLSVELQSLSHYDKAVVEHAQDMGPQIQQVHEHLNRLQLHLQDHVEWIADNEGGGWARRFEQGVLPADLFALMDELRPLACGVMDYYEKLLERVKALGDSRDSAVSQDPRWQRNQVALAALARPLEGQSELWRAMTRVTSEDARPMARWLLKGDEHSAEDVRLFASPTDAASYLQQALWSRCFAAILTSATLSVGGDFQYFRARAGLPENSVSTGYASPFDYPSQGSLELLDIGMDPGDHRDYYDRLADVLSTIVAVDEGTLVLFSARKHLREVGQRLEALNTGLNLLQQEGSNRAQLIQRHRELLTAGSGSCLMGLASFAEGLDLPGKLLTHVVITRLPFSVPDEPVEATLSEWLKSRGRNPFFEVSLPAASLRLVQASGRLLRHETDSGRISLLDRRLWTRRYGGQMLSALPPFRRKMIKFEAKKGAASGATKKLGME
jgi:ATP-dependent DNA helicase DinG